MRALLRLALLCLVTAAAIFPGEPGRNWTANYSGCDQHSELLKKTHLNLGVRFSTSNLQLMAEFARALDFWAGILDMEWHEDDSRGCAIDIIDGPPDLFIPVQLVARGQLPDRSGFQGIIAFNPDSNLTSTEQFYTAVHELGHLLGLPHNPSASSILYYLEVDEPFVLDTVDLKTLADRHRLRIHHSGRPLIVTAVPIIAAHSRSKVGD